MAHILHNYNVKSNSLKRSNINVFFKIITKQNLQNVLRKQILLLIFKNKEGHKNEK